MQNLSDNQCANILTNLARIWAREHGCEVTRCKIKKEGMMIYEADSTGHGTADRRAG